MRDIGAIKNGRLGGTGRGVVGKAGRYPGIKPEQ